MPIYEYECTNCGQIEEIVQKINDKPLETCSHCKGKMQKLISHSSFHLKGGGWYADSYGNSGSATDSSSSKKASSTSSCGSKCGASTTSD